MRRLTEAVLISSVALGLLHAQIVGGNAPTITTTSLPTATGLQPYDARLAATGGTTPYYWTAIGLPRGLSINSATGEITGTPTSFGNFAVAVFLLDNNENSASALYTLMVTAPGPPPQINSGTLPPGFVNVSYNVALTSSGGNGALTYGVAGGSLPPGILLDSTGLLRGLPTTVGTYTFSVTVTDADGYSSTGNFTLVIKPQPLSIINSSPLPSVTVGSAVSVKFTAFGGVQPYTFSGASLPPGTNIAADGTLSGTATTVGTFAFTVTVSDSASSAPSTKNFSLTVNPAVLTVTGSFGDGQVGVAYTAQVGATGGVPPYSLTLSALPDGLTFANGAVSGTPTTAGRYIVTVTVTDSKNTTVAQGFTFNIAAPTLTITTSSLPNGVVNVAYTASLNASGGSGRYTWTVSGLPAGVTATAAGAISGTPSAAGNFSVSATVTDTNGATASKTFPITVAPPPLIVTTASLANATVGTAYSATMAASGGVFPPAGVPAYTWTAVGLPPGLSISAAGVISGTPAAAGSATVTVTVKDSAGTTASQTYTLTTVLPPTPPLTVTGLPATSPPATQTTIQIGVSTPYPVAITVNLVLTFAADSGPDDPSVQFATGGRTAQVTIPAGSTSALTSVGIQTGTVAGTITITAHLLAGGQDITPTPVPTRTVRINSVPPVATSVTATATSTGFTVTVIGYATARSVTQAIFVFAPAAGVNLQTTTVTIPVTALFSAWYASSAAVPFGGQFLYTLPFTVTGGTNAVASVTVTLVNADGTSVAVTAAVH